MSLPLLLSLLIGFSRGWAMEEDPEEREPSSSSQRTTTGSADSVAYFYLLKSLQILVKPMPNEPKNLNKPERLKGKKPRTRSVPSPVKLPGRLLASSPGEMAPKEAKHAPHVFQLSASFIHQNQPQLGGNPMGRAGSMRLSSPSLGGGREGGSHSDSEATESYNFRTGSAANTTTGSDSETSDDPFRADSPSGNRSPLPPKRHLRVFPAPSYEESSSGVTYINIIKISPSSSPEKVSQSSPSDTESSVYTGPPPSPLIIEDDSPPVSGDPTLKKHHKQKELDTDSASPSSSSSEESESSFPNPFRSGNQSHTSPSKTPKALRRGSVPNNHSLPWTKKETDITSSASAEKIEVPTTRRMSLNPKDVFKVGGEKLKAGLGNLSRAGRQLKNSLNRQSSRRSSLPDTRNVSDHQSSDESLNSDGGSEMPLPGRKGKSVAD